MAELDEKVMTAIARRRLTPRSAAYFLARRSVLWTLAGLSAGCGAVAVAVLIYAFSDYFATSGRRFDQLPFDDFLGYMPFAWLFLLALLTLSTVYAVRLTRDGYRYRSISIAGIAIALSIGLGALLHVFGAGWRVHEFLEARLPYYAQLGGPPPREVSAPESGQLAGRVIRTDGTTMLELRAFDGTLWTVDIHAARITLNDPLAVDEDINIQGSQTGTRMFKAETVVDWD